MQHHSTTRQGGGHGSSHVNVWMGLKNMRTKKNMKQRKSDLLLQQNYNSGEILFVVQPHRSSISPAVPLVEPPCAR
ncbi:hypothetical protein DAI22_03g199850 [Oryza sativa Japonica Group]|nr:hypothetical protein DAI22_03g199850 [Oryza sativa Japonica Group]